MKTVLLILALNSLMAAQPQSLGDAARQERNRQKTTESKNTFTNETLGIALTEPDAEPADKSGDKDKDKAAADATKAADSKAEAAPRDEVWWRDAFKQARDDAKRAEDRSKVTQLELNQLNMDLLTKRDSFNPEADILPKIAAKNAELAKAEKDAAQANEKVKQLEDDLRRSGAPAGWAR